eukprot:TRINITY_DN21534_c0_g1_i1.p1 TRINITY_DN21534_c0_g1~~TRINITY_DN21534_c0_g1_i1.p1  ORF type:complete len:111 (-),score=12.15 TRINITY_DN21534_c0_g1_i1:85-417(-)
MADRARFVEMQEDPESVSRREKKLQDWHSKPLEEIVARLQTDLKNGMRTQHATEMNRILGDNALSERKRTPWYVELFKEMVSMFSLLLWAGAGLSGVAYLLNEEAISHVS